MRFSSSKAVVAASLLLLGSSTFAAAPSKSNPAVWTKEPDSFMGIRFDQKIDQVLPLCPSSGIARNMCHDAPYNTTYRVRSGPDLGFGYGLHADSGGQGVESFYMTAKSEDYASLSQLLISKYGPPTERTGDAVKTKGGAEFRNETLLWKGSKVIIFVQKYSGDIDTSAVSIRTMDAFNRQSAETQKKAQESASKL